MRQPIPRAVTIVVALHAIAALAFGALAHLDPSNQFPDLLQNDDGLFAGGLYANRNIGVGLALVISLALGARLAVAGLMLARFLTDAADLIMALTQGGGAGAVAGQLVFFSVLFASELYVLRTIATLEPQRPQEAHP